MEAGDERSGDGGKRVPDLPPEVAQECRDSISQALADVPERERDLEYGVAKFPPEFALDDWKAAATSENPGEREKVSQILWQFVTIVNHLNTIIMNGTVVTGLMPRSQLRYAAPAHYKALEKAGLITDAEREDLGTLNDVRVGATHWYARTTPEQLHEGIEMLRTLLASPTRDKLESWIADEVLGGGPTESGG